MKKILFTLLGSGLVTISMANGANSTDSSAPVHINPNPYILYRGVPVGLTGNPNTIIKTALDNNNFDEISDKKEQQDNYLNDISNVINFIKSIVNIIGGYLN